MQITMTCRLASMNKTKLEAEVLALRRSPRGPVEEPFHLRFGSELAFHGFAARHKDGDALFIIGRLGIERVPAKPMTKGEKPMDKNGMPEMTRRLVVRVKDHHALHGLTSSPDGAVEADSIVVSGIVSSVLDEPYLGVSPAGFPYYKGRVVCDGLGAGREQPSDYYATVAFGGLAERMAKIEKARPFLIEWAGVSNAPYETEAANGVRCVKHAPELTMRDIRYLPRDFRSQAED